MWYELRTRDDIFACVVAAIRIRSSVALLFFAAVVCERVGSWVVCCCSVEHVTTSSCDMESCRAPYSISRDEIISNQPTNRRCSGNISGCSFHAAVGGEAFEEGLGARSYRSSENI